MIIKTDPHQDEFPVPQISSEKRVFPRRTLQRYIPKDYADWKCAEVSHYFIENMNGEEAIKHATISGRIGMLRALLKHIIMMVCLLPTLIWAAPSDWAVRLLDTRSPASALENPALLGGYHSSNWAIELPGGTAAISNNSFSVRFWNESIAGDAYWDAEEIQTILNRIPESGLRANLSLSAPILSVRWKDFAFNSRVWGGGRADLPKDAAELAFVGTKLDENYSISDITGSSAIVSDYSVSWGHRIRQAFVPELSGGLTVHYFAGHVYTDLQSTTTRLFTSSEVIRGSGQFQALTAYQGSGFGADFGFAATFSSRWKAGLALQGLSPSMRWMVDETSVYSFATDEAGLILDSLDNEGYTDRVFESSDTTLKGGRTTSRLPMVVRANAVFLATRTWSAAGLVNGILNSTPWADAGIEVGTAAAWQPKKWGVMEGGILAGGPHRLMLTLGGGLRFNRYELDVQYSTAGGLFNSAYGAGVVISQRLFF